MKGRWFFICLRNFLIDNNSNFCYNGGYMNNNRRNFLKTLLAIPAAVLGTKFLSKKKLYSELYTGGSLGQNQEFKPSWTEVQGFGIWPPPNAETKPRYIAVLDKKSMKQLKKDPLWKQI